MTNSWAVRRHFPEMVRVPSERLKSVEIEKENGDREDQICLPLY